MVLFYFHRSVMIIEKQFDTLIKIAPQREWMMMND